MLRGILTVCFLTLLGGRGSDSLQQSSGEVYFSVSPDDHTVVEGLPVVLKCEAEPKGSIRYSWKIDDQPLAPSPRRHLRDGDLVITRVNRMLDSGSFVCVAEHDKTGVLVESSPAKINVQWISESSVVLQQPKPAPLIRMGAKVELRCHVDGSGELQHEWFRNTKKVVSTNRVEMKRNLLLIAEVNSEDNGVYHCLGKNAAGSSPVAMTFPLIVPNNDTATLRVAPQKVTVKRGDSATFSCVFDNVDRVQWYFEDRGPLESDDERSVFDNGTLVVLRAEDRDRGVYSCHGVRADSAVIYTTELHIAYLKNLEAKSFEPPLQDQLAVVGENQELQVSCLAPGGLPPPKLFWKDPQGRIISDSGQVRVQDDTLIIAKARPDSHQGNYTCYAENMAGTTHMSVRVVVSWQPELKTSPHPVSAMEDDTASMSCTYVGMEPPVTQTRWLKDGEPINLSGTRHRVENKPGNSTLVMRDVQPSDRGMYSCEIATKGFGAVRSEAAQLGVKEKLKFSPVPVNKRFELNSTAKVPCKAQGLTPPSFKWYKNGGEPFPKHVQEINGTLHFGGVLEGDKGNYTCVATNSQGQINHTISIDVVIAPKFTVKPVNITEYEGAPVLLQCAAEGDPKPAIHWDKNYKMLNANDHGARFEIMPNGSLYFPEVFQEDQSSYGCTAGNSGGLKRAEMHLIVKARDGYRLDLDPDGSDDGSMMTKTVIITLGAATAYMVLVIGLMLYCRYRRRRRKQRHLQEQTDGQDKAENAEVQEEQCELRETSVKANSSSGRKKRENRESHRSGDGTDTAHSQNSTHSKKSKSSYDKLVISRSCLHQDMKPLGRGEFGEVFSTRYRPASTDESNPVKESVVMVKALNNSKDESILIEFKRHLDFLRKLNHENVARLIGLCKDEEPEYMVIEYTDWGDLKQYLLATKFKEPAEGGKPSAPQLTIPQIISLANQAARGLKHVSDHRLVHKDVAARNCLISSNLTLKITMSCMTKEPHQQEYTKHRNQLIPLRWTPKEAVLEDEYSTKSDVYSYSCLLWEMFHQGELPFKKLNDDSIISQLKAQTLVWAPHKAAPPALQEMQAKCWSYDPRERPTFDYIVTKLQEIIDSSQV